MSLLDARNADEALAEVPPRRLTPAQRAMARREKRVRALARMIAAVTRLCSANGNVSRRELLAEGFTEREIDRHFPTAARRAGLDRMVS